MNESRPGNQRDPLAIDHPSTVQEALRQERDFISAVLDTVGALVVVLDRRGRIVRFNQSCERVTGYSLAEVADKYVWDLFLIPEEVEPVKAVFAELQAGEFPNEYENYWVTREGDHRLIAWSNTALLDNGGEVEFVIGTGIEITERRQAEEGLQKLTQELGERVKELDCLYGISALVVKEGVTLAEILQGTVDLVPAAWQYPEIACARITLDGHEFSTGNCRETVWWQTCDIRVHGRRAGRVEVGYLEERPEAGEGPFLKEERSLLNAIAEQLGSIAERVGAEEEVERLAKFPSENPSPVLRISQDGSILYANQASFPLLDLWGCQLGQPLPDDWRRFHLDVLHTGLGKDAEVEVEDRILSLTFAPVVEAGYVNVYGLDITDRKRAEKALRRSQERYALAQKAANIGSWDWDIRTNDLHWSDQIEPMFGFGRGEFGATYEAFLQCVHPEDRQYVLDSVNACVQECADYAIEHRIIRPDGTVRWMSETGDVIRDENGSALRMLGVVQDITEHKRAQERIRQQNEFLTSVLESLTHPFYVVDVADYTVLMANTAAFPGSLPEHSTCYALFHDQRKPCVGPGHVCPMEEIKRTKESVTVEHIHHDASGRARNVEVRGYPLFDHQGNVVRVIEYCLDVTERRLAEEALQESEARWRSVTENSPDHVILLDRNLTIQFVNYASPGLTVEELIGTPLYKYATLDRQSEIRDILEGVLRTTEPTSYETQYSAPDGHTIYYESRVVPRTLDGQVVGLAINARDISEHRQVQEALRDAKEAAEGARREEQKRRWEADRRRRIAESLADVLAALNSNQPLGQILDHIAEQASELLDTQAVAICQLQGGGETLSIQAAQGLAGDTVCGVDTLPGIEALRQAVASRQALAVPDLVGGPTHLDPAAQRPLSDPPHAVLFRALLAVPIMAQAEVYGGMVLYYAHPRSFSHDEVELSAVFSNQIALAIENARLREQLQQTAAAAERSRLARDLHDSVTQALFSASLVAEILPRVWQRDPEEAQDGLEELRHLTRGALAEMRTMLLELRPTALMETKLDELLLQLTEAITSRAQLPVVVNIEPNPTLPSDVHVTFYRVAQEALHNVVKHAEASQLCVSLRALPPVPPEPTDGWRGQVVLRVSDNGRGFDPDQIGGDQLGVSIMRERAQVVGAKLTIESQSDQGTQVTLVWEGALP